MRQTRPLSNPPSPSFALQHHTGVEALDPGDFVACLREVRLDRDVVLGRQRAEGRHQLHGARWHEPRRDDWCDQRRPKIQNGCMRVVSCE